MDEYIPDETPDLHAEYLIKTFASLYDNWSKRPDSSKVELEALMKIFRQDCDNYGF